MSKSQSPDVRPHPVTAGATAAGAPVAAIGAVRQAPPAVNEPVRSYAPGSPEKIELKARLASMASERADVPLVIGGRHVRTGDLEQAVMPHDHHHVLADWHRASPVDVEQAIAAALGAQREWSGWAWEDRAAVFLRAAELLATSWRATLNAATMLGQSKTVFQAEIDAACELIDFWRFNVQYARELYEEQPLSDHATWNQLDYRPLEGFVFAVTPFNFTAIAGNLPTAPALMGNTVVWKPASSAMLSAWWLMRLLEEAGLPPGVINLVAGDPAQISEITLGHRELAGMHFTGSTAVFNTMWERVGRSLQTYRAYPRLVGETGGKNFVVVHASADLETVAVAIARGGYEYQGQKCSAVGRVYVPASLWPELRDRLVAIVRDIRMGDVGDFRNFMGAVIDERACGKIGGYLAEARRSATVVAGGNSRDERGWFVEPTLVETDDPGHRLLREEIFGPVVTVFPYSETSWRDILRLVDETSDYGLTGAIFARDRRALRDAVSTLRHAAGNLYVNDKPTGAVVGRQPFGGARASGTNDKAGSKLNLVRWVSARAIKETFAPPREYRYPFMDEE